MRSIVLEKLYAKSVEGSIPSSFSKKNQNEAYLWINSLKFKTVCFYCMSSCGLWKYIETKLQTTWFYLQ